MRRDGGDVKTAVDPVIVTDGHTRAALAATRALAAHGVPVHVLSRRRHSLAGASRAAAAVHRVPDPVAAPASWTRAVGRLSRELGGAVVLPITDVAVGTLHAFADGPACVAIADAEACAQAVDKHALLERAEAAGLQVPRSVLVPDPAALADFTPADDWGWPLIAKSRRSHWLDGNLWCEGAVRRVSDRDHLRALARDAAFADGLLIQECVEGHGEGLFVLMADGHARVRFAHRRVREKPPAGGTSVVCASIAPDPELVAGCERLLADLGWDGVAMLEFRRAPDGAAYVMELNPRLWGSLQLALDAGVDFPTLAVAHARGEKVPEIEGAPGHRLRWLLGDVDHLWIAVRDAEQRRATGRSLYAVCRDFVAEFLGDAHLDVLRWRDLRPFLHELRHWFRR